MKFFRIFLIVLLSVLTVFLLIFANIFMVFNFSYGYNSISKNIHSFVKTYIIQENKIQETELNQMIYQECSEKQEINIVDFKVPCSEVTKSKNYFDNAIAFVIDKIYYSDYNCSFLDCYKIKDPLIAISKKTKSNLSKFFLIFLFLAIFLFFLIFLIFKNKHDFIIFSGAILVLSSPATIVFKKILDDLVQKIGESKIPIENIFNIFFRKLFLVFFIWFAIGVFLIIFGIIIKKYKKRVVEKPFPEEKLKIKAEIAKIPEQKYPEKIKDYIRQGLKKGYTYGELKNILVKAGHKQKQINQAIEEIKKELPF